MKVLVACEYSGIVRDELCKKNINAYSCDILPSDSELTNQKKKHIQDDLMNILHLNWDVIIAFPPCTDLSNAQAGKIMNEKIANGKAVKALEFIKKIYNSSNKICIENPVSSYLNKNWIPYSQIIEPYFFGHNYRKKTCLWLKNLPPLISTLYCYPKYVKVYTGKKNTQPLYKNINKKNQAKFRSEFHTGVAQAIANQWF